MIQIYNFNNLPFYSEEEILEREFLVTKLRNGIQAMLLRQNKAWQFKRIEAPCLIPRELVSANYTNEDMYVQQSLGHTELVLKPETTPSTYAYMKEDISHGAVPPVCYWQVSKSFRREQDQPSKHCRFKEFYQQEFQCLYTEDTKNDYQAAIVPELAELFQKILVLPTRIVLSDRLPSYSLKTIDIEVDNGDKWMEIASISVRNDFDTKIKFKTKEVGCLVLEIAIGIDRLIYNRSKSTEVNNLSVDNTLN